MVSKKIQWLLIGLGIASLVLAFWYCCNNGDTNIDNFVKAITAVLAFNFIIYKLIVGWFFINLTVEIKSKRQPSKDAFDDLAITLTLSKGGVDSVWIKTIEIKLSEVRYQDGTNKYIPLGIICPIGFKKLDISNSDYWNGRELPHYTISVDEAVPFSAYTKVHQDTVIAVEVVVLGSRSFYGFETLKEKLIQWRSSEVVLPCKKDS